MQELCRIMNENERLFPRYILFRKSKYIIYIAAQQADETEESLEGKKKLLKSKLEKDSEKQTNMITNSFKMFDIMS